MSDPTWDGDDWSAATKDGIQVDDGSFRLASAIPDSVVHQYTAEDFASPWPDNVSSADMAVNGLTSATMGGSDAVSGDGTDDHGLASIPDSFPNQSEFAVAFTVESPDINDLGTYFGVEDADNEFYVYSTNNKGGTPGNVALRLDDSSNVLQVDSGATTVDDGTPHAVVVNKIGSDVSNWGIYIDDMTSNVVSNTESASLGSVDYTRDVGFYAANTDSGIIRNTEMSVGVFEFWDTALTQSEREDFVSRRPEV